MANGHLRACLFVSPKTHRSESYGESGQVANMCLTVCQIIILQVNLLIFLVTEFVDRFAARLRDRLLRKNFKKKTVHVWQPKVGARTVPGVLGEKTIFRCTWTCRCSPRAQSRSNQVILADWDYFKLVTYRKIKRGKPKKILKTWMKKRINFFAEYVG